MAQSAPAVPGRIFISYRREDTAYPAGWLFDQLTDHFGAGQVFKDVDSIDLGDDDVLLVLIGKDWLTITDAAGRRRLDDPNDFVRLEIETALRRDIRVVPIVVEDATLPRPQQVPESLAPLVRRQALVLRSSRFEHDTMWLLQVFERLRRERGLAPVAPSRAVREERSPPRRLKVFLCHSSSDKPNVRSLYGRLQSDNIQPWLDEEDLLPGQDWDYEISKAIRASDVVLVCLSRGSIDKVGYLQREIRSVLDVADEQPPGTIFLIPVRLEPVDVPDRLRRWHWVNLFEEPGYSKLIRALRARAGLTLLD